MHRQTVQRRGTTMFRLIIVLVGVAILSGCVVAPGGGYGYGYGYRVHPLVRPIWHPAWRRGWGWRR